jgi:hypothetical protein
MFGFDGFTANMAGIAVVLIAAVVVIRTIIK